MTAYQLRIKTPDGVVLLPIHRRHGEADPDELPPHILAAYVGYQQGIIDRVDAWDLWRFMDEPGRMAAEYRRLRREEPELAAMVRLAVQNIEDPRGLPEHLWPRDYVLPSTVWQGHTINADFMVDRELGAVYMFAVTNTTDRSIEFKARGLGDVRLMPGTSTPVFFECEGLIDPRPVGELILERYRHWDVKHNHALSKRGAIRDLSAFGAPVVEKEVKEEEAWRW